MMNAEQLIRAGRKRKTAPVEGSQDFVGEVLTVGVMSGADRDRYDSAVHDALAESEKTGKRIDNCRFYALLACLTLVDADGNRIFSPDDAPQVAEWQHPLLEAIYEAAEKLNKLSAKTREQDAKN